MRLKDFVPDSDIRNWVGPFQDEDTYLESGRFETERFISLGGIGENDAVLDLGCGCGRMSIHLAGYLSRGTYVGVDASPPLLSWCVEHITPAFGNTSFFFIDAYNAAYNPEGKLDPGEVRLGFPDHAFDVVMAQSLFTHLRLKDVDPYLREAGRVLKPAGTLIASFYLLYPASLSAMESGAAGFNFSRRVDGFSGTFNPDVPEDGLAHEEAEIMRLFERTGFKDAAVHHGSWIGRQVDPSGGYQDVMVAHKPG